MPKYCADRTGRSLVFVYSRAGSGRSSLRPREYWHLLEAIDPPGVGLWMTLAEIYQGLSLAA
jgi:hypothetical protein